MFTVAVFALIIAGCAAFHMGPAIRRTSSLSMALTAPGKNMKPQFDGTFKEAGAHLETYVLEHEDGSRALVDTKTATCISWKDKTGTEYIASKDNVHVLNGATLKGEFVPEERAKKVSFDRMIFKTSVEDAPEIEYRCDVTLRPESIEYDITIKNGGAATKDVVQGLALKLQNGAKVTAIKGFKTSTDTSSEVAWTIPVGKFKETEFYLKISK